MRSPLSRLVSLAILLGCGLVGLVVLIVSFQAMAGKGLSMDKQHSAGDRSEPVPSGSKDGHSGTAIFTQHDTIIAFDLLEGRVVRRLSTPSRIRYAIPRSASDSFIAVVMNEGGSGMRVVVVTKEGIKTTRFVDARIGAPVASSDGKKVAWVSEDNDGKAYLTVCQQHDLSPIASCAGPFVVDNVGPNWLDDREGRPEFIVATRDGQISRASTPAGLTVPIVKGKQPVVLHGNGSIVFFRDDSLWKYDLRLATATRLCSIEQIADHYTACRASPGGRSVLVKALFPYPLGRGLVKSMPATLMIKLSNCSPVPLTGTEEFEGPWAWVVRAEPEE